MNLLAYRKTDHRQSADPETRQRKGQIHLIKLKEPPQYNIILFHTASRSDNPSFQTYQFSKSVAILGQTEKI